MYWFSRIRLLALLQLKAQQIAFRRVVQIQLEKRLQRGARQKEFMADLFDRDWLGYLFIHIGEDLLQQFILEILVWADAQLAAFPSRLAAKQCQSGDDLLQMA